MTYGGATLHTGVKGGQINAVGLRRAQRRELRIRPPAEGQKNFMVQTAAKRRASPALPVDVPQAQVYSLCPMLDPV